MIYLAVNQAVLSRVSSTARRVLDLGCGSGASGREMKLDRPREVTGVTLSATEAEGAFPGLFGFRFIFVRRPTLAARSLRP